MRAWRLYADVGNSALLCAVSGPSGWGRPIRMKLDPQETPADTAASMQAVLQMEGCRTEDLEGAALVSSNPRMTGHVREALERVAGEVAELGREMRSDLTIDYYNLFNSMKV